MTQDTATRTAGVKRFEDLTDEEILALTEDEIRLHIDYECAVAGAPLLPPEPGPAPEKPKAEPDVEVFTVGDINFKTIEEANEVARLANGLDRYALAYVSGPGYEKKVTPDRDDVTIETSRHYSPERYEEVRDDLDAYQEAKREHFWRQTAYRDAERERQQVRDWIRERVSDVRQTEAERQDMRARFERYLDIADGDRATARRFLSEAHPEARELLPHLWEVAEVVEQMPAEDDAEDVEF